MKGGWIRFCVSVFLCLFLVQNVAAGDILASAQAARVARLSTIESKDKKGYVKRSERHYLITYSAHTDISLDSILQHHDQLKELHGETLFLGEITHHTLWTGFSIAINKQKAVELHPSAARKLDAVAGDGAWLQAHEQSILQNIRALPYVKTVHKVRKISTGTDWSAASMADAPQARAPHPARRLNATAADDDNGSVAPTQAPTAQPTRAPTQSPSAFPTHMPYNGPNPTWFTRDPDVPLPWGLDRLDQRNLPLDKVYNPQFNGTDVNVFIVDTGLDTKHIEFTNIDVRDGVMKRVNSREVANIFDAYVAEDENLTDLTAQEIEEAALYPSRNNDAVGHGTHVAATIGGNNVGVSPGANLYGIRVLNAHGSGSDEVIILGLLFVFDVFLNAGAPPSVINMSLGGSCNSYEECSEDALVSTVEKLATVGLNVVVAAGNSGCDACLETPAFAANAITVGASDVKDKGAYFSDYGKCIDVYAPGVNITSACASVACGGMQNQYTALSGTSMATPHTVGVLAQLLQLDFLLQINELAAALISGNPDAGEYATMSSGDILDLQLTCSASKQVLSLLRGEGKGNDKVSRNLLLQLPRVSAELNLHAARFGDLTTGNSNVACQIASGCAAWDMCSGHGICQEGECLCDTGFWGDNCESTELGFSCTEGFQYIPYTLFDLAGTGESWVGAEFRIQGPHTRPTYNPELSQWQQLAPDQITNTTEGHFMSERKEGVIPVLASSMCSSSTEASGVCLAVSVLKAGGVPKVDFAAGKEGEGERGAFTEDAGGNIMYSYSLDVIPKSVMRGFSASWEMCGRRGGAPARWELQVYSPSDPFVHNSTTNGTMYRNGNDNYGDAADDDAWKEAAPAGTFKHNATYCSLQCADLSAIAEINLYLQNPWDQIENDDTLVTKNVNIGTPSEMLQDGSPRPGTQSVPVGYSLLDAHSGIELAGGSWIMDAAANEFLTEYMKVYFNNLDTPAHKQQLAELNKQFPLKQTHSFCVTAALLKAIAAQNLDNSDTNAGSTISVDLALVTFGAVSLQWSLAFEMCGVHIPAFTDFSMFRFVFTRGATGAYDSYKCAYVSDTGEDLSFPTAAPTAAPSAAAPPAAAAAAAKRHLGGSHLGNTAAAASFSFPGLAASTDSSSLKTVKVGISNAVTSNFSRPVTADSSAEGGAAEGGSEWGWNAASYSLQSVRPSTQAANKVLSAVADCAETLSSEESVEKHAAQCLHPLLVNATLYNGIQEVQVQEWRMTVTKPPGAHTASPAGSLPFYVTCGIQAHSDMSSFKFKPQVAAGVAYDPTAFFKGVTYGWSSLPSQPVPLQSSGIVCQRDCVALKASGKDGVPLTQELSDAVKPMLIVVGLNDTAVGNANSALELQKLVGLVTKNKLCIGNATTEAEEAPQTCTTLILGAGTQSLYPLWDLSSCQLERGYTQKGASMKSFMSADKRQLYPSTAVLDVCVTDWTDCKITAVFSPDCSDAGMDHASTAGPYHRDMRLYMYPPTRSNPFPPITRDVDKDGVNDEKQSNLVVKKRVRHGFYLYMYGDSGSWVGAQFMLFKAPDLGVNMLKAYALQKAKGSGENQSKVAQKLAGFNVTVDDDDTHAIGSDDDPFVHKLSRDSPFDLITSGTLDQGKDSAAAALCLTDGCYMLDITRGKPSDAKHKNKGNLFIFCGKIGSVGDGAYVGIHDGQCVVYPDLFECQLTDAYYHLSADLWGASASFIGLFLLGSMCVLYYCRRGGHPAVEIAQKYRILPDGSLHPVDSAEQQQQQGAGGRGHGGGGGRAEAGYGTANPLQQARDRDIEMTPPPFPNPSQRPLRRYPGHAVSHMDTGPSPVGAGASTLPDSSPQLDDLFLDDIDTLGFGEEVSFERPAGREEGGRGGGGGGYNQITNNSSQSTRSAGDFKAEEFPTDFGEEEGALTPAQIKANLSAALNE